MWNVWKITSWFSALKNITICCETCLNTFSENAAKTIATVQFSLDKLESPNLHIDFNFHLHAAIVINKAHLTAVIVYRSRCKYNKALEAKDKSRSSRP